MHAAGPLQAPLLRAGVTVSERLAAVLADKGTRAVWVHDELSAGIEPVELVPEAVRAQAAAQVAAALNGLPDAFAREQPLAHAALDVLGGVVERICAALVDPRDAAALNVADLAPADAHAHRHSVNVTALGLLIGRERLRFGWIDYRGQRRFDRVEQRLARLGLGLLLHDIGKLAIPTETLAKAAGELTDAERELLRAHPEAGAARLSPDTVSPLVRNVVRDHHERVDGSGYPRGITGERIDEFARIAAIADVYDRLTSQPPDGPAAPPHVGVRAITAGAGRAFDPELVGVFGRLVFPYPVGGELTLPDGRVGVVAAVDPARPEIPVVRVDGADGPAELPVDLRGAFGA